MIETIPRRRQAAAISWRAALALVLGKSAYDAASLLIGGDRGYPQHAYDFLREIAPGGMRAYGFPLAVLFVAIVLAVTDPGRSTLPLRWLLALQAGWHVGWLLGIVVAWTTLAVTPAWAVVSNLAVVAGLAILVARAAPALPTRR